MEKIREKLVKLLKETCLIEDGYGELDFDCSMEELGINSISFVKLVVAIESEFGIEFDHVRLDIRNLNTINKVAEYVNAKMRVGPQ